MIIEMYIFSAPPGMEDSAGDFEEQQTFISSFHTIYCSVYGRKIIKHCGFGFTYLCPTDQPKVLIRWLKTCQKMYLKCRSATVPLVKIWVKCVLEKIKGGRKTGKVH